MLEFFNIDVDAEIESIKSQAGWTLPVLDFACCRSENGPEKARSPSATVVRPGPKGPQKLAHNGLGGKEVDMARYVTTVRTAKTPRKAFDYMADLRNFAEWDPGVKAVKQVEGSGGSSDAVFDVTVAGPVWDLTLRYVTEEYDAPRNLLVVARSLIFTSIDRITVEPDGKGSVVTYDADLRLNGPLRVGDLGLRLVFGRIGDRAAAGLRRVLGGQVA